MKLSIAVIPLVEFVVVNGKWFSTRTENAMNVLLPTFLTQKGGDRRIKGFTVLYHRSDSLLPPISPITGFG